MRKKITLSAMIIALVYCGLSIQAQTYNDYHNTNGGFRAVLLEESFEGSYPPEGWTRVNQTLSSNRRTSTRNPSGYNPYQGNYLVYFNSYTAASGTSASLTTPVFDASDPNTAFSFVMFRDEEKPTNADVLNVEISTDNGETWTPFAGPFLRNTTSGYYWEEVVLYITEGTENTQMRFVCTSAKGNDIHIDYVRAYTYFDHDLTITSATPNNVLSGTTSLIPSVTIKNIGVNSEENWTVNLNNGEGYNSTITGSALAPNETITVDMDEWTPEDGNYIFTATITMSSDEDEGNNVFSYPVLVAPLCEPVRIDMNDSYGDGWNGVTAIHVMQSGALIATATVESEESFGSVTFTPYQGEIDFVWIAGNYDDECSFSIHFAGNEIYTSPEELVGGTFFTWTCGTTCDPVTDLTVAANGNNVDISWSAPQTMPTGYEIYFNNLLLETISATSFTHSSVPDGIHTYMVRAMYDEDCFPVAESAEVGVGVLCTLSVNMADQYEDGWNNAKINIRQNGTIINSITMPFGYEETTTSVIVGSGEVEFIWVEGEYDSECSFTIHFAGNQLYASSGTPSAGVFLTWICGTACDPVTNLSATENGDNVDLTWNAPNGTPSGYEIYFNNTFIEWVTETSYTHLSVPDGLHSYTVKTLFGNDCIPAGESIDIVVGPTCELTINMYDANGDGWDGDAHVNVYQNNVIIANFKLEDDDSGSTTILLYGGEVQFSYIANGSWDNENSFTIEFEGEEIYSSGELPETNTILFTWVCGVRCDPITNLTATPDGNSVNLTWTAPASTPSGYEIYFEGALLTTTTTPSYTHTPVSDGHYNYSVSAIFDEDCIPVERSVNVTVGNLCALTFILHDNASDGWNNALINIVQEGIIVESITMFDGANSTELVIIPGGESEFVWAEGEYDDECSFIILYEGEELYSSTGEPMAGTFLTWECGIRCDEIRDLAVTVQGSTATLTWNAPATGTPTTYLIYLDGLQTDEISTTEQQYDFEWMANGNYTAAVAAKYDGSCTPVKKSIDFVVQSCGSPTDLTAIYNTECHAILTWTAPSKTPNTYTIYRDDLLIASDINFTTYTDINSNPFTGHTWEVLYFCPEGGESEKVSVSLPFCDEEDDRADSHYFDQLTISPNPAKTIVTISGATISKLEIFNAMGQIIASKVENINTVNVSSYNSGIYLFKLYNGNNEFTVQRVVIVR